MPCWASYRTLPAANLLKTRPFGPNNQLKIILHAWRAQVAKQMELANNTWAVIIKMLFQTTLQQPAHSLTWNKLAISCQTADASHAQQNPVGKKKSTQSFWPNTNKADKESQYHISAVCQYLDNSSGPKYRPYLFYYSLQLSDKTTVALLMLLDLPLHILTPNIKLELFITISAAAEEGGWCNGEYLLLLISCCSRVEQIWSNKSRIKPPCPKQHSGVFLPKAIGLQDRTRPVSTPTCGKKCSQHSAVFKQPFCIWIHLSRSLCSLLHCSCCPQIMRQICIL